MSDRPTNDDPTVIDPADQALLEELRVAASVMDGPPAHLLEAARAAFVWRTIDEELAHLQFDSLAGSEVLVRSSGASGVHLSFATTEASIEVDVTTEAILGQVVPAEATEVVLLHSSGERVAGPCDELGQFHFPGRPAGPIRLVVRLPGGDVVTEWFTV